jgi:hypothetical protein
MEGYRWHCPHNSFIYRCERRTLGADNCTCEPLQRVEKVPAFAGRVLLPRFIKSTDSSFATPSIILQEGAVVFGDSRQLRKVRELATALGNMATPMSQDQCKESPRPPSAPRPEDSYGVITRRPSPCVGQGECLQECSTPVFGSTQPMPQVSIGLGRLSGNFSLRSWRDTPNRRTRAEKRTEHIRAALSSAISRPRPRPMPFHRYLQSDKVPATSEYTEMIQRQLGDKRTD